MTLKNILEALTRPQLKELGDFLDLDVNSRMTVSDLQRSIAQSGETVSRVLEGLNVAQLRQVCRYHDMASGGVRDALIARIAPRRAPAATRPAVPRASTPRASAAPTADFTFDPVKARHEPRPYQREAVTAIEKKLVLGTPGLIHVATGGGKTRIANDYVAKNFGSRQRGWILWVTKDWELLEQAATDLAQRHVGWADRLQRWGGDQEGLRSLPEGAGRPGTIVYSTLATLAYNDRLDISPKPALIVWDECHWGAEGDVAKRIRRWGKDGRSLLLGLTATPRRQANEDFEVIFARDFISLVDAGYLARPVITPVKTGVDWTPQRSSGTGDIRADSLDQLARQSRRNKRILKEYTDHADKYGKTIVFACNIWHAEKLHQMFREAGVPSEVVHSERESALNQTALAEYDRTHGGARVIINVAKLTTGYDAPHTRSIFMARPTLSDVLFAQMFGRGARLHEPTGKSTFHVVEFADTAGRLGQQLQQAKQWYDAPSGVRPRSNLPRSPKRSNFDYDPDGIPVSLGEGPETPEALRGLWTRKGQTFGLEFEMTHPNFDSDMSDEDWLSVAEKLRTALAQALPGHVADRCIASYVGFEGKDHQVWNVEYDGSCGWEVTTRVLEGEAGMQEVVDALAALSPVADELGLRVNHSTGTHVHIGWRGKDGTQLRRALELARIFEPALATLVSPSRIANFDPESNSYDLDSPNQYCAPISKVFSAAMVARINSEGEILRRVASQSRRYVTLNLRPLKGIGTMEIRMHNGTLDASKILLWLSLWQQIFWAAEDRNRAGAVPAVVDVRSIRPTGDILALAHRWLPWSSQTFRRRLHQRRSEVANLWRHDDLKSWLEYLRKWDRALFEEAPMLQYGR